MNNRLRVLRAEHGWSQQDLADRLGVSRQSVNAIEKGRYDPSLPLAFSIAALGMMGAPLTAGAVSKEWLMKGAVDADMGWAVWVLWTSSVLNAAYFLPILWRLWFRRRVAAWPEEYIPARGGRETHWMLLLPPVFTALATLGVGVFATHALSPLSWAKLIAAREYLGAAAP